MSKGPAYHGRTHRWDGTDPIGFRGNGLPVPPWSVDYDTGEVTGRTSVDTGAHVAATPLLLELTGGTAAENLKPLVIVASGDEASQVTGIEMDLASEVVGGSGVFGFDVKNLIGRSGTPVFGLWFRNIDSEDDAIGVYVQSIDKTAGGGAAIGFYAQGVNSDSTDAVAFDGTASTTDDGDDAYGANLSAGAAGAGSIAYGAKLSASGELAYGVWSDAPVVVEYVPFGWLGPVAAEPSITDVFGSAGDSGLLYLYDNAGTLELRANVKGTVTVLATE